MSASPLRIPDLGEGVDEGIVVALRVAVGDTVVGEQIVLEIETDKVTVEVPAPRAGVIHALCVGVDDTVRPGDVVLELDSADDGETRSPTPAESDTSTAPSIATDAAPPSNEQAPARSSGPQPLVVPAASENVIPAGPGARREARELGIDITEIGGSGRGGRISREDVRRHARDRITTVATAPTDAAALQPLPDLERYGPIRREAATRIERTTAANLARAATVVPHAWVMRRIDVTALETARRALRAAQSPSDAPLTLTAVLCKAAAVLLTEMPRFNAAWDDETRTIVYREYVHIGVAVDTPLGLLVPVIRDADALSVIAIAEQLASLSEAAREGRLEPALMRGAGITLSNLGGLGVEVLQPVVNWPEAAIIGVGSLEQVNDTSMRMALTLGFDHRLINGADAARFLARFDELLSDPLALAVVA